MLKKAALVILSIVATFVSHAKAEPFQNASLEKTLGHLISSKGKPVKGWSFSCLKGVKDPNYTYDLSKTKKLKYYDHFKGPSNGYSGFTLEGQGSDQWYGVTNNTVISATYQIQNGEEGNIFLQNSKLKMMNEGNVSVRVYLEHSGTLNLLNEYNIYGSGLHEGLFDTTIENAMAGDKIHVAYHGISCSSGGYVSQFYTGFDFAAAEVPEPTTLSLLAVGGLFMLRKKRKKRLK